MTAICGILQSGQPAVHQVPQAGVPTPGTGHAIDAALVARQVAIAESTNNGRSDGRIWATTSRRSPSWSSVRPCTARSGECVGEGLYGGVVVGRVARTDGPLLRLV